MKQNTDKNKSNKSKKKRLHAKLKMNFFLIYKNKICNVLVFKHILQVYFTMCYVENLNFWFLVIYNTHTHTHLHIQINIKCVIRNFKVVHATGFIEQILLYALIFMNQLNIKRNFHYSIDIR